MPAANDLGPDDLVLCSAMLLGRTLSEKIEAARSAGFRGISLFADDVEQARGEGIDDAGLRARLADAGLAVAEIDPLGCWLPSHPEGSGMFRHTEADLCRLAEATGARSLNVVEVTGAQTPVDEAAEAFAGVCDRARERGLLVGLEFMPFGGIPSLKLAAEIVRSAGRPNGGLMLDTWHLTRSGGTLEELCALPGDAVLGVQISDAPLRPEGALIEETMNARRFPGDGDVDLVGFVRALDAIGSRAPLGIEVLSEEARRLAPEGTARRAADGLRAVLAQARP